ncbi:MAG TPA: alpha/beta hydrolase [Planctomycetaceae bacterium]|jgi:pimeloyl-ACP methyl ester carboxylesterase|nr:alpha/beta hydrolase [Planctomycetaceae bacterium]
MSVPEAQRAGMLGSREGVLQALTVLVGAPLSDELREQVIEDTLQGAPEAKRAWTEHGMIEDVSADLDAVTVPVTILVGSRDPVEHESALREVFGRLLPHATVRVLEGIGHLSPLEAPGELADACAHLLAGL